MSVTAPNLGEEVTGDDFVLTLFHSDAWEGEPRNVAVPQHHEVAFLSREQAARLPLANRGILSLFDRFAA